MREWCLNIAKKEEGNRKRGRGVGWGYLDISNQLLVVIVAVVVV